MREIIMPAGGQTTDESVLLRWHVQPGDTVKRGDCLFDIETDKAVLNIESYLDGVVDALLFAEGDTVATGQPVARIRENGKPEQKASSTPEVKQTEPECAPQAAVIPAVADPISSTKVLASPLARARAREMGIVLADIARPESGVIKVADIEAFVAKQAAIPEETPNKPIEPALPIARPEEAVYELDLDIRAERIVMLLARLQAEPTTYRLIDLIALCALRARAHTPEWPDTDPALVRLSLAQIAGRTDLTQGKLRIDDLGATGARRGVVRDPNADVCLGVGKMEERAVVENGQLCAKTMLTVRILLRESLLTEPARDAFLQKFVAYLETPELALV